MTTEIKIAELRTCSWPGCGRKTDNPRRHFSDESTDPVTCWTETCCDSHSGGPDSRSGWHGNYRTARAKRGGHCPRCMDTSRATTAERGNEVYCPKCGWVELKGEC